MKKAFSIPLIALCILAFAQITQAKSEPTAIIRSEKTIGVDKVLILDGSESINLTSQTTLRYAWDFGDGNRDEGIEVVHSYRKPGNYTVSLTVDDNGVKNTATLDIFAFKKSIVLIADDKEKEQRIQSIMEYGKDFGVQIDLVESFGSASEFISEEILTKKLNEIPNAIKKAQEILVWTKTGGGLDALARFLRENKKVTSFQEKTVIIMQDELPNMPFAQRQFRTLLPEQIILVKEAAIYPLIESEGNEEFVERLKKGDYEFKMIDALTQRLRPLLVLTSLVTYLTEAGIPENTLALILLLPVIATVISFMKQVIGITTLGIYTPSIFTLIFLTLGLQFSLISLVIILTVGIAGRFALRKLRLLYIPKLAIVISLVSLAILALLLISARLKIVDAQFISLAIFPVMIMVTLTEKFINVQKEKGLSATMLLVVETVIAAIIAYFVSGGPINLGFTAIQWEWLRNMILTYPEFILVFIVGNIFLGRWTGLRLFEYIRFREILKQVEE